MGAQTFGPDRGGVTGRVLLEGKSIHIPDVLADSEYKYHELARVGDFRTILGVPLLRERILIGVFLLQRAVVRPFSDKQIKLPLRMRIVWDVLERAKVVGFERVYLWR